MPKEFDMCRQKGGKIITKKVNGKQYMHICYLNGKAYAGDVKEYKSLKGRKSERKAMMD